MVVTFIIMFLTAEFRLLTVTDGAMILGQYDLLLLLLLCTNARTHHSVNPTNSGAVMLMEGSAYLKRARNG